MLRFRDGRSRLRVTVRAANDGVAFRTALSGPARRHVTGECSTFRAPRSTRAWLQRYGTSYERPYDEARLRSARPGAIGFPALLDTGHAWTLLSESAIGRGQSAARLRLRDGVLEVQHARGTSTPWRVAVIGSLATIVGSDLVDDLAPSARGDWSWVRPGRVAWSWWSDSGSPASLARQQQYVDFAARMGWEYVLVDEGWDPSWIPALTAYARDRGVGVLLWSRWDALATPAQRDALLAQWSEWGVAGVKLDFMQSDSAARMRWYRDVARAAADRRLVVDFHGATVPRGLSRTFPNVLTQEAVRGAEYYKGDAPVTPAHNTTLPFTRGAIGPMDYTPVAFSAPSAQDEPRARARALGRVRVGAAALRRLARGVRRAAGRRGVAARRAGRRGTTRGCSPAGPAARRRSRARSGDRWYVGAIRAGAGGAGRAAARLPPAGPLHRRGRRGRAGRPRRPQRDGHRRRPPAA